MAGNADFVLTIDRWVEQAHVSLEAFVKRVVFEIYYDVVMMTPVDTGRLRANYQIGVNIWPEGVVSGPGQVGTKERGSGKNRHVQAARNSSTGMSEAVGRGNQALAGVTWGTIVYIVNNLPYAMPIEFGHSTQAPQGMARIAVKKMADKIKAAAGSV